MLKILKIIGFFPISAKLRGYLYRFVVKLSGKGCVGKNFCIGFGSYIDARVITINENVALGNLTRIKNLDNFEMGAFSTIGSSTIICGAATENKVGERIFKCGVNVDILCSHYFDVAAPIIIGDNVTIAGKWTQFYTHSFDLVPNRLDGSITLGNHIYVGAGCIVNLGVKVCDNVVIQGGTVVNKSILEPGVYTSNVFTKRGEIHEYSDLFQDSEQVKLSSSVNVFVRKDT